MMDSLSVFIGHSSLDKDLSAIVKKALQGKGLKTFTYEEDIQPGNPVIKSLSEGIHGSKRFLMLLTKKSYNSPWCKLETILALEKAQNDNIASAMFLVKDIEQDKLPQLALFNYMNPLVMEFDDQGEWNPSQIDELVAKLKEKRTIKSILPAGNLAHGQAWSHFLGFHNIILPCLKEKIEEYKKSLGFKIKMPTKVYELIPESCKVHSSISSEDTRVKKVGKLPEIKTVIAGNPRIYTPTVYKIMDGDEEYYCVAQYPSTLGGIKDMENSGLAEVTKHDRRLQLARYFYTMNSIINHPIMKCQNRAKLLLFNDEIATLSQVLLEAIKKDLQFEDVENTGENPHTGMTEGSTLQRPLTIDRLQSHVEEQACDAYIIFNSADSEMAEEMRRYLEGKDVKLFEDEAMSGNTEFKALEKGVKKSRWLVVILSKSSLKDKLLSFKNITILTRCVNEQMVRVIPVLVDVNHDDIPDMLRWIVYIKAENNDEYLKQLCCAIKGDDIPMSVNTHIPAGNVAHGLAWAYYLNFLQFVISDCVKQIEEFFKKEGKLDYKCPKKLYILIPESCNCGGTLDARHANISIPFENTLLVEREHASAIRKYNISVHQVKGPEVTKECYFAGLYAAPVQTLYQMKKFAIAGVSDDTMKKEAQKFCEILKNIIENSRKQSDISQCCKVLYFEDDNKENLAKRMIEEINAEDLQESGIGWWIRRGVSLASVTGSVALAYMIYRRFTNQM